ncbi:MAG: hypothetical protein QXI39_00310 [Candidatus Bathyarchaeia archaeon]
MPYIRQTDRKRLDVQIDALAEALKQFPLESLDGCLNYAITRLLKVLYQPKYFNYNRAIGVLECCKLEFYRRCISPYEDAKIRENGDV